MSSIGTKSAETLAVRLISQLFSVLGSVVLARGLGPFGKGIMTYTTTVMSLLQTLPSGQTFAIAWQVGRQRSPSRAVAASMFKMLVFGALPIALVVLCCAIILPGQKPLVAVAIAVPFVFFSNMALGFSLAEGNIRISNVQSLLTQVPGTIAFFLLLFVFHQGLAAVLTAWVVVQASAAIYTLLRFKRYVQGPTGPLTASFYKQLRFGLQVTINGLVGLLNFRIDVFVIMYFLGVKALGIYSIGVGMGEMMWQLARSISNSAFGRIGSSSLKDSAELTAKCARHSFGLTLCIAGLIFIAGPPLITLVYGSQFSGAGPVVRLLLPGMIAYSMMPMIGIFFSQQLGKPSFSTRIGLLSTAICFIVTVATIRPLGILGGALGTSVSYVATFILGSYWFSRETKLPMSKLFLFENQDWARYRALVRSFFYRVQSALWGRVS